jgi:hypothetical protein
MALVLGAAGIAAAGLAGYAWGKRRERREIENGYLTYHDNGQTGPQYGNIHYGSSAGRHYGGGGHHHGSGHRHHQTTGYYTTG